jgi:hypothetical protein
VAGDVDAAIEYIIVEKETDDSICNEENSFPNTNGTGPKWNLFFL